MRGSSFDHHAWVGKVKKFGLRSEIDQMHTRVECGWPGGLLGGSRPGWRIPRVGA